MAPGLAKRVLAGGLVLAAVGAAGAVAWLAIGLDSRDGVPAPSPEEMIQAAESEPSLSCAKVPFAEELAVSEASGAVYIADAEPPVLLVVSDSGNRGRFIAVAPEDGRTIAKGRFQLDRRASDDLEGLAYRDGIVYGITSSGWMRHWKAPEELAGNRARADGQPGQQAGAEAIRVALVQRAYPVVADPDDSDLVCSSSHDTNCARNYEGLCLRAGPLGDGQCVGFAVSKTDGALYCLVLEESRLRIDPSRALRVLPPGVATGCHFDGTDTLWLGTNWFGSNRVYRVTSAIAGDKGPWATVAGASSESVGALGSGFGEALAAGPGGQGAIAIYRFSDAASSSSLADKYICE